MPYKHRKKRCFSEVNLERGCGIFAYMLEVEGKSIASACEMDAELGTSLGCNKVCDDLLASDVGCPKSSNIKTCC